MGRRHAPPVRITENLPARRCLPLHRGASPYHPSTRLSCQKTVKTNHGLLYKIMDFLRKTIDSPVEIWHNIKDNNKRGDGPK